MLVVAAILPIALFVVIFVQVLCCNHSQTEDRSGGEQESSRCHRPAALLLCCPAVLLFCCCSPRAGTAQGKPYEFQTPHQKLRGVLASLSRITTPKMRLYSAPYPTCGVFHADRRIFRNYYCGTCTTLLFNFITSQPCRRDAGYFSLKISTSGLHCPAGNRRKTSRMYLKVQSELSRLRKSILYSRTPQTV